MIASYTSWTVMGPDVDRITSTMACTIVFRIALSTESSLEASSYFGSCTKLSMPRRVRWIGSIVDVRPDQAIGT